MISVYDIPFLRADGTPASLAEHRGKVLLVINVASKCGFTRQYDGLQALFGQHQREGLVVVGFPANDFAGQEPGTDAEIQEFCRVSHGVEFPVHARIAVTGPDKHPLYQALTEALPTATFQPGSALVSRLAAHGFASAPGEVTWNFEKFLIDRQGNVVGRYGSDIEPDDAGLNERIRGLLAA